MGNITPAGKDGDYFMKPELGDQVIPVGDYLGRMLREVPAGKLTSYRRWIGALGEVPRGLQEVAILIDDYLDTGKAR